MKKEWQKNLVWLIIMFMLIGLYVVWGGLDIVKVVRQSLPSDEAELLLGIILGDKSVISRSWYEIFQQAGLLHIVVASGANISILIKLIINSLASWLGRKKATVIGLMVVFGYVSLVGLEAPMIRALIIFIIYYWAQLTGRKFNMITAVILMAYVLVLVDSDIFTKVSFWLSLSAFWAVFSFGWVKVKTKKYRWINVFWLNVWINLFIWPITAWVFGEINWLSLVANPLVLFGVETIYGLSMVTVGLLAFWPAMVSHILIINLPFLKYFLSVAKVLASWQWGVINIKFNWLMLVGWYMVLAWWLVRKTWIKQK